MDNMKTGNETLSYMIYMANRWSKDECVAIYGEMLGNHIWNKYINYVELYGLYAAMSKLIFELDNENMSLLVGRATSIYDGRNFRK